MSDRRSRALLLVGLGLAMLTAFLLYGALTAARPQQPGDADRPRTQIVVARSDLSAGTLLAAEHLERRPYPTELVPAGAITDPGAAVGRRLSGGVGRGVPLTTAGLSDPAGRSVAGIAVEPGRVLYAFTSPDPLTSSGLIQAGDRVDVLATVAAGADARVTQRIVQDLTVMQVTGGGSRDQPRALIFLIDHQTALVLKHLRDAGALIDLVVRSPADPGGRQTRPVNNAYIVQTYGLAP